MCAGAMVQARLGRLVYAVPDHRAGAAGSVFDIVDHPRLNHRVDVVAGVLHDEGGRAATPLLHAAASGAGRGAQCQQLGGMPVPPWPTARYAALAWYAEWYRRFGHREASGLFRRRRGLPGEVSRVA